MAEKASEGGGSSRLNLNSLMALLALAGSVWFVSSKLTSDRPVTAAGSSRPFVGEQTLEARLWEDPFKEVEQKSQQGDGMHLVTNLNTLVQQVQERSEGSNRVLLLPVMLSGGQYSEDQESRIRSRFAIVSALGRSGYAPEDAEHLGALRIPWPTQHEIDMAKTNSACTALWPKSGHIPLCATNSFQMDLRYEWYRPRTFFGDSDNRSFRTNALVLWLDDSFFEDEPMLRLPLLLESLLIRDGSVNVALIGPRRSSTLRAMLPGKLAGRERFWEHNHQLWRLVADVLRYVELYCATPSAMDEVLVTNFHAIPRMAVGDELEGNGFKAFHNYAATDAQLAQEVLGELALRSHNLKSHANHLVLVSEWDTFYARILSLTYAAEVAVLQSSNGLRRFDYVQDVRAGRNIEPSNFHSFVYLRGLDGQKIGGKAKMAEDYASKSPTTSFEELRKWVPDANKAEGQAQFDYLGRLGDQLEELEDSLQRENARTRIAVGIVGSDVYDTLLILQALRPRFPNFHFFTTDLDARFWHPRERKWCRNLIVASAYGLTLHPNLQKAVAPFRDSTQTAQFAAALAALGNTNLANLTNIPPRRFEIGNHGAVDLSVKPGLLLASNVSANTVNGPWLHPLTAQQIYEANRREITWPRAFKLFPWPFQKSNLDRRTGDAIVILSLYGLAFLLVIACIFWQPLRVRTWGVFRFPGQALHYRSCDVGGPDGVAELLARLSDTSKTGNPCKWLAAEWQKNGVKALLSKPNSFPPCDGSAMKPVQTPTDEYSSLLLRKTNEAATREAQREYETALKVRRSHEAYVFVQFLNRILDGKVEVPAEWRTQILAPKKTLSGWMSRHLMTREETRRFLDKLLDGLSPKAITESRQSIPPPNSAPAAHVAESKTIDENQPAVAESARLATRNLFWLRLWNALGFWIAAVAVVALACWVGSDMWQDAWVRPDSEPFSLTNGISGWPAIILRLAAVILSLFFCFTLCSQMRVMFCELTRYYRFPLHCETTGRLWQRPWSFLRKLPVFARQGTIMSKSWKRAQNFFGKLRDDFSPFRHDDLLHSGQISVALLWYRYCQGGHPWARILRVIVPCLIYFLLASVIYQLFGASFQPLRGAPDSAISQWNRFQLSKDSVIKGYMVVNFTFFFLTFLTIDAACLCRGFIEKLSTGNVEFPTATRDHFRRQRGDVSGEILDDWIGTRLIADLTDRVGKLLWFPGIVFLLLLMARLPYWDHWPWHPAHIIIMILNFCIALASGVILQRAAREGKAAAEERLTAKVKRLQAQTTASPVHNDAAQAEKLLDEIKKIHHGAFGSIWDNPVLGALMVGPGGLTLMQALIWFLNR